MAISISPQPTFKSVFFEPSRKRFQDRQAESAPSLLIDVSGMIKGLNADARRLLEYAPDEAVEPCFFSHVHGKNQYQVMRDVADMIVHGKHAATWFLRMRTGRKRWQWFRAYALNDLSTSQAIRVRLSEATPEW